MFSTEFKEMVNTAIQNLYNQGQVSIDEASGQCRYRGCNGNKCIVGWMIPDEKYNERIEGSSAYGLVKDFTDIMDVEVDSLEQRFLSSLQDVHDELNQKKKLTKEKFREHFIDGLKQMKNQYYTQYWILIPKGEE